MLIQFSFPGPPQRARVRTARVPEPGRVYRVAGLGTDAVWRGLHSYRVRGGGQLLVYDLYLPQLSCV